MNNTTNPTVLEQIEQERAKQISKGFDAEHDDAHPSHHLPNAILCLFQNGNFHKFNPRAPQYWPWSQEDWDRIAAHPRRQQLVICAAMIVADIEKGDRLSARIKRGDLNADIENVFGNLDSTNPL